jgi:hypothetical protein
MSQKPSTPATPSRPPKRAHEEEPDEPSKRPHQHGIPTPPEQAGDVGSNYAPATQFRTPQDPSLPPVHPAYPSLPRSCFPNPRMMGSSYVSPQDGLYAPVTGRTYGSPNGQYGIYPALQPQPGYQVGYGQPYHGDGSYTSRQLVPEMQPMHAPGIHVPHNARSHEPYHPVVAKMVPNFPHQQQQQQRVASSQGTTLAHVPYAQVPGPSQAASIQSVMGTQGAYKYSTVPTAAAQAVSHLQGVQELHPGMQVPVGNGQAATQKPRTQPEQWLIDAQPDLQGKIIAIVPGIPTKQSTIGALDVPIDYMLVPRDIWRLRSLSPSQRYAAYHGMVERGREMSKSSQASNEYQGHWKCIVTVRESLLRRERNFAKTFKQGTPAYVERWKNIVEEQAVETPVDKKMVDKYAEYPESNASKLSLLDAAVKTRLLASDQVPAEQKPAMQQKPLPQPQAPIAAPPVVAKSKPVETFRPDMRRHPQDKVKVPPYPLDKLEYFTPSPVTGRYKCMHEFATKGKCCKEGLSKNAMKASIHRSISTWMRKVERLIDKGLLHPSHKTWENFHDPKQRDAKRLRDSRNAEKYAETQRVEEERAAREEEVRVRNEKKAATLARLKKKWREQPRSAFDAESALTPILAPDPLEQDAASTTQLSLEEESATEIEFRENIAKELKKHEQLFKERRRCENMKKWPNWPRFNAWWAARRVEVQLFELSPEQETILKGPEPSGIPDKNPAFVKGKRAEETVPVPVQEPVDARGNVGADDSGLDARFENDGSES